MPWPLGTLTNMVDCTESDWPEWIIKQSKGLSAGDTLTLFCLWWYHAWHHRHLIGKRLPDTYERLGSRSQIKNYSMSDMEGQDEIH